MTKTIESDISDTTPGLGRDFFAQRYGCHTLFRLPEPREMPLSAFSCPACVTRLLALFDGQRLHDLSCGTSGARLRLRVIDSPPSESGTATVARGMTPVTRFS